MTDEVAVKTEKTNSSLLIRGAIWIAIGALIAAAIVCVIWVLIGDQDGLIGRAFLTILLLAAFAGIAILEASLAPNRPDWLALSSMIAWIIALLVGAVKIWLPRNDLSMFGEEASRFFDLLLVIAILQLALLHVRLFTKAAARYVTTFTRVIYLVTVAFLIGLVGMLVFHLTFPDTLEYSELYWRIVVALTILAAVGTTLIPLLNVLFAPKRPEAAAPRTVPSAAAAPGALQPWPTYADGATPLPMLNDGSPDWNAYYTGFPTPQQPTVVPRANFDAPTTPSSAQAASLPGLPPVPSAPTGAPLAETPATPAPVDVPAPNAVHPAPSDSPSPSTAPTSPQPPTAGMPQSPEFPPPPPAAPRG